MEGLSVERILFNSSTILSPEIMLIRSAFFLMDCKDFSSISKPNWLANLIARSIRKGSSEKVISGSSGVLMILFFRADNPLKGSDSSPKSSLFKDKAKALMVKSRRFWSSSKVPFSTTGFRLSKWYDSFRAPTNSTSISSNRNIAVP